METHVKVLGILHIVFGAMGVLGAVILIIIFGGVAGIAQASGDPDAALAVPIIGITGTALVIFLLALSLPGVIIGFGVYAFKPWARVAGIVWSIFDLFGIPLGTLIGIYGLFVLFSKESER